MDVRASLIRSFRTFLQGCVAVLVVFFTAIKGDGTFINIKAHGAVLFYGFFLAFGAALVSFIQNLLETRWGAGVPRG